jgi:hypothetical protein
MICDFSKCCYGNPRLAFAIIAGCDRIANETPLLRIARFFA